MISRRNNKIKVAFQGEAGAYSEEAGYKYFGNNIETIGYEKLDDVFRAVEKREVEYGVVPVENSIEGTVRKGYELFLEYNVKPVAEVILRIRHCLIALPGESLKSIKFVYSHPQALGQCSRFLEKYKYKIVPFYNTAGSVKMIKEKKLKHTAAIASERAGKIYGMKILKKGIENNPRNFTRFLIIERMTRINADTTRIDADNKNTNESRIRLINREYKTSLIFTLEHVPGSLFRALKVFAKRNINLTKIESIPISGKPWEYNFFLDFEGHIEDKKIISALEELKKQTTFLKIIGSYPKANFIRTKKAFSKIDIGLDKIAIIGAGGNMGQWFCKFFKERGVEVIASDINKNSLKKLKENLKVKITKDNKEAVKLAKFILISVLPQNFEEVVKEIYPYVKKDQIIFDITSLKEKPVKIMHKYFKNNLVLGTHPLWGPASKENLKMILTPTNKKEKIFAEKFKKWLETEGIKVILMSPQKQDRLMALVSGLPHFVALVSGSTLEKYFRKIKDVYGSSFEILSSLIKRVVSNSPYLFSELQFSFPKMKEIEDNFEKKVRFWREIIKKKDRRKFIQEMLKIRSSIESLI